MKGAGIIAVGRMLQAAGYQVGEHPAFGGVTGVHTAGSAHYRAGAIDVNHDQGNEMAWLDRAAKQLLKINHSQIIWRNHDLDTGASIGGHMDHLHFAMQRGGILQRLKGGGGVKAHKPWREVFGGSFDKNEVTTLAKFVDMNQPALMAAIAMAESSGDPGNVGDGGDSIGLWQINKPSWGHTNHWLSNPINNARLAKQIARSGLSNWTMYRNGGYREHLGGQVDTRKLGLLRGTKGGGGKSGKTRAAPAAFNVDNLMLKANQKGTLKLAFRKMAKLPGMATVAGELADRAEALTTEGPDGQGVVDGKNAIMYLTEQLNLLWAYRNWLVIAHNLVTRAVAAANEQIAKAKPGKGKTKMKEARNLANTKLTEIGSSLTDIQGTVVGGTPFGYMKTLPSAPGMFGGQIFDVQMRLKDLGETSSATDKTNLSAGQLKELSYLSSLGVKFNPSQFAGFFAGGGVLGAGQWGIAGERGPEAVVGPAAISPGGGINVRVFIGDRELTDIVRVETDARDRDKRGAYMAGRGAR